MGKGILKEIREDKKTIKIDSDKYLITGSPFYNNENENKFKKIMEELLNLK
jgi:type III restriction enzyme